MLSQDQVLNIPGIFELILLSLPARNLLTTAPLVCQHWRDFIASSTRLQQELFFQPVSSLRDPDSRLALPRFNPLLEELFPGFFEMRHGQTFNIRSGISGQTSYYTSPGWSRLAIVKQPRAFVRSGASWRRMLPRQPPPILANISILDEKEAMACRAPSKRSFYWRQLVDNYDDGDNLLRMGVLYDLVHDFCDTPQAECAIVWADKGCECYDSLQRCGACEGMENGDLRDGELHRKHGDTDVRFNGYSRAKKLSIPDPGLSPSQSAALEKSSKQRL